MNRLKKEEKKSSNHLLVNPHAEMQHNEFNGHVVEVGGYAAVPV